MNLNQFFSTGKLQGDWLCQMGKGNFRPPTESTPLNRWPKNLLQVITSRPLRLCQIRCTYVHGGFWAHGWNITKLIFIYAPFWGTYLQVRHVDGFSRIMAQTTRTRARMCLFKDFSHGSPLRGSPKKNNFWTWIGVFKPNSQNRKTCILSKLLHRFQPNFAQW